LGIDQYGYLLRKIDNAYNESVVAGDGVSRLLDGLGTGASFKNPTSLFLQSSIMYIGDGATIRKVDLSVTTDLQKPYLENYVLVYPNPSSGNFSIQSEFLFSEVYLIDLLGHKEKYNRDNRLKAGSYVLEIVFLNGETWHKMITIE
jgi:hypothetical protein